MLGWREGLTLLFRNLIDNSKIHGKIPNKDLNIGLTIAVSKNWLTVTVEDDGKGIAMGNVTTRFVKGENGPSFIIHVQLLDGDGFACRGLGKLILSLTNNEGTQVESELFNLEDTTMNTSLFDGVTRTYRIPWSKMPSNDKVIISATFKNKSSEPIKSNTLIVER